MFKKSLCGCGLFENILLLENYGYKVIIANDGIALYAQNINEIKVIPMDGEASINVNGYLWKPFTANTLLKNI